MRASLPVGLLLGLVLLAVPLRGGAAELKSWKEIEALTNDQKLSEAAVATRERLAVAKRERQSAEWTRALVKLVQLELGLHGYERAVRLLRDEPRPPDEALRLVIGLYESEALLRYADAYRYELQQRTPIAGALPADLSRWTLGQVHEEAVRVLTRLWERRDRLARKPAADHAELIEPSSLPPPVRGTLRDVLVYRFAEVLGERSRWSAEEENALHTLDAASLLGPQPARLVSSADAHPLRKLAALLEDHENWHRSAGRPEAAFEARLERSQLLHGVFVHEEDRALVRKDLTERVASAARLAGRSRGRALLAQMWRDSGALVQARKVAEACVDAGGEASGIERCRHLLAAILAPDFQLAAMTVDAPGKRSVEVTHRNLPRLHLRAYRVDLERELTSSRDYSLLPQGEALERFLTGQQPVAEWVAELPPTRDHESHRTQLAPPSSLSWGTYLLVASAERDFRADGNRRLGVYLTLSQIVLQSRTLGEREAEIEAVRGDTGAPMKGVEVRLYAYDFQAGHSLAATQRTDANGLARIKLPKASSGYFILARSGEHVSFNPSGLTRAPRERSAATKGTLLYLDRSIFRPGQTVQWKAVAFERSADGRRLSALGAEEVTVELRDVNGEVVHTHKRKSNAFGSVSGSFVIPEGRLLGEWSIQTLPQGHTSFRVEAYKRPTFEVVLDDSGATPKLNAPVQLGGKGTYLFGLPVTSGTVRWQVVRRPLFVPRPPFGRVAPSGAEEVVAAGTTALDGQGHFSFTFTPRADPRLADTRGTSFRFEVKVDVTDEGGETRSAERTYRIGFAGIEPELTFDKGFFEVGTPAEATLHRRTLDGAPRAGKGSWRVMVLDQPERTLTPAEQPLPPPRPAERAPQPGRPFRTEGDERRSRLNPGYSASEVLASWPDGEEQAKGELLHGADGTAKLTLPGLPAGAYRLHYQTRDESGALAEASREFLVVGPSLQLALPGLLLLQQAEVRPGGTLRALVHSGFDGQHVSLELFRDGQRVWRRTLVAGERTRVIEVPVKEEDRGGLTLAMHLVRDYQLVADAARVGVPFDDHVLQVEFASFREPLRPGAKETFRVVVRRADGKPFDPKSAEVLAYMYDRALDALAPHSPPDPASLRGRFRAAPPLQSLLGSSHAFWLPSSGWGEVPPPPEERKERLKLLDGHPIGGPGRRGFPGVRMMHSRSRSMKGEAEAAAAPVPEDAKAATDALPAGGAAPAQAQPLRSNFAETAFFLPNLVLAGDGSASWEFQVPDSVTDWSVWAHAWTGDLSYGRSARQTRSQKELMVRPYLPRFLREGDHAEIRVALNSASARALRGTVTFELFDAASGEPVSGAFGLGNANPGGLPFTLTPGGSTTVTFAVKAPPGVRPVNVRVKAAAEGISDGEERPLPILPSRLRLMQSRFVALREGRPRELGFADAGKADATRTDERLVVTVDAQLIDSVLASVPSLMETPYEACTEQMLNRYFSAAILSTLYKANPELAARARAMSSRQTVLEPWNREDPNRKMLLQESPWLVESAGGPKADKASVLLDPEVAEQVRSGALAELQKAQTSIGGWPWFSGGPPSPFMTLYLLHGFSRSREFGFEPPQESVTRAWAYLGQYLRQAEARKLREGDCCWELGTFLVYVASGYPDEVVAPALSRELRAQLLSHSFRNWRKLSPYLKGMLSLALQRAGRSADARTVWASVMDSAKTTEDEGTFWAPEARAWLWYNDTVEGHAFALSTLLALSPEDQRRHGLVQWLFLNKKLNQWKSSRATAEALYALVKYLRTEGSLSAPESVRLAVGGERTELTFGKAGEASRRQLVFPGPSLDQAKLRDIRAEKEGGGVAFVSATWHFATETLPKDERGDFLSVSRSYFLRERQGGSVVLRPLQQGTRLAPGDVLEIRLDVRSKQPAEYVHLMDPRAAGVEPEGATSGHRWNLGISWYEEVQDSGTHFFFDQLPAGEYTLTYRARASVGGEFRVGPAMLQSFYAPEFSAYSTGARIEVSPRRP